MRPGDAFTAGVVGGITLSILEWVARTLLGISVNIGMIWGTMFLPHSANGWLFGLLIHLVVSGIIGVIYALVFEFVAHRTSPAVGVAVSLVHFVITGLFLGILPGVHPRIPEAMLAPGIFLTSMGVVGVVTLLVLHVVYGATVGATYGRLCTRARRRDTSVAMAS